jgi:cytochrome c-type biogenesis protein
MEFGIGTYSLGYMAGVLSTLSPCVLPLVPIVLGSAMAAHRLGALALTVDLVLSFTAIFIATVGVSLGFDATVFRKMAAVLLIVVGVLLTSATLQARLILATSGISDAGQALLSKLTLTGLAGQFAVGLALGAIWNPCVGPSARQ